MLIHEDQTQYSQAVQLCWLVNHIYELGKKIETEL